MSKYVSPFIIHETGSSDLSSVESANELLRDLNKHPQQVEIQSFESFEEPKMHNKFTQDSFYHQQLSNEPHSYQYFTEESVHNAEKFAPKELKRMYSYNSSSSNETANRILKSNSVPVDLNACETNETITVNGHTGIWANKEDMKNWKSILPIQEYPINDDASPEMLRKTTDKHINYKQEFAVRYLRPPTPPSPGDIIIEQDEPVLPPQAPPIVIRQQPPRPSTPEPLILREVPPPMPPVVSKKVIRVAGGRLPPPPRQVIIERLAPMPPKPQPVIIERWLGYKEQNRRVVFKKSTANVVAPKVKNVIIQWDSPKVNLVKEVKDLGVVRANPSEYMQRYGNSLKRVEEMPDFVKNIEPPAGLLIGDEQAKQKSVQNYPYELEGDVFALKMFNLHKEGLSAYSNYLNKLNQQQYSKQVYFEENLDKQQYFTPLSNEDMTMPQEVEVESDNFAFKSQLPSVPLKWSLTENVPFSYYQMETGRQQFNKEMPESQQIVEKSRESLINQVFRSAQRTNDYYLTNKEAKRILCTINERLNQKCNDSQCERFLSNLVKNTTSGLIDFEEFKSAVIKSVY